MSETFNEQDFEELKKGSQLAADKFYKINYSYVLGILIHRQGASREDAEELFTDAVIKFQNKVQKGEVVWGNMRAYVTKIAINYLREKQKRDNSLLKKTEQALQVFYDEKTDESFDKMVVQEEKLQEMELSALKAKAVNWAMSQLDDTCKELLNDTIIKGIKPRFLVEKFSYKSARVVTDKKVKCKKKLLELTQLRLSQIS